MRDLTGLDSLVSPCVCLVVLLLVQLIERGFSGMGDRDILFFLPKRCGLCGARRRLYVRERPRF
jgi:hypothetical protein